MLKNREMEDLAPAFSLAFLSSLGFLCFGLPSALPLDSSERKKRNGLSGGQAETWARLLSRTKCRRGGEGKHWAMTSRFFLIAQDAWYNDFFWIGEDEKEAVTVAGKIQT